MESLAYIVAVALIHCRTTRSCFLEQGAHSDGVQCALQVQPTGQPKEGRFMVAGICPALVERVRTRLHAVRSVGESD